MPVPSLADLARPLDDDEWKALTLALNEGGSHQIDVATGLLTAVVTAPTPIPPSTWLPIVLGDLELDGPDDEVLGLVLRMYNTISSTLREGQVMCPAPEQVDEIEQFCIGYMMGVDLDDIWEKDDVAMGPVAPIAVLAGVEPLNHPDDPDPIEDEEGFLRKAREQLPALVLEAFESLKVYRRPQASQGGGHRRSEPKVGRNDPCPCGSGKKYKKCCGR